MNKKHYLIISLLTAMLSLTSVSAFAVPVNIPLHAGYEDPNYGNDGLQKGSIPIPSISLDDYSLIFNTPCDGYTLRLLDEDGVVVYSIVIPTDTTSLVLPSWLSGEYEIQIIQGSFCFHGYINF